MMHLVSLSVNCNNHFKTGVRASGMAAVDPQRGMAVITIEGGNEPHGVFSFATVSLERRVIEGDNMAQLTVDRKFGSIGKLIF